MKTRTIISMLLALLLIVTPIASFAVVADDTAVISFVEPAIPAIVGESIDLSEYEVEFAAGKASKATFKNGDVEVKTFTPSEVGVTVLTAVNGNDTKNVYIVAKNKDDSEYVLYYNGFDDDSALADLSPVNTKTLPTINDGKLYIKALGTDSYRVLLPEWLGDFGNYRIEMKSMVEKTTDTARWQSIMFRVQKNNFPYYHMCIRQNAAASNGVEFALRTPSNTWEVQSTGSFTESQKSNTYYTHSVEIKDNLVKECINDVLCVWNSTNKAYTTGRIGIQANYTNMYVDYIKVTLQLNAPERPKAPTATITTAEVKNITNSIANVAIADRKSVLDDLKDAHSVILYVNGSKIVAKNGSDMFEIKDLYDNIGNSIIPVFYIKNNTDADEVLQFISSQINNVDFSVMSDDPDVVKYARSKNSRIRGIIDLSNKYTSLLTSEEISQLRLIVNSSLAKTAVFDISCLDKETVINLQSLNINVWVTDTGDKFTVTNAVRLLVSGANGVVTNSPSTVAAGYEFFDDNALTRTPLIIGHRGNPTNAPENSIASYLLAWENGADIVETDIYLSKDNEIVIMHDSDISRTTDGKGAIENMTVEQLQKYHVWAGNANFKNQYPDEVIPTLRDMFEALKDTDAKIFIEIKSSKPAICQRLADLVEEYGFSERVCVISFNAEQLKNLQKVAPQITCGYLLSASGSATMADEAAEQVFKVINFVQPYNASYNPSNGNQSEEFIDACTERGIAIWPWTYSSAVKDAFCNAFRWGYNGLTTNDCQLTANTVRIINASLSEIELKPGENTTIEVNARTYGRTTKDVASKAEMVILEGNGVVSYNKGVISAENAGTAVVMFKYSSMLIDNKRYTLYRYTLYTSPVTINVQPEDIPEESIEESSEIEAVVSDVSSTSEPSENNALIWIIVAAGIVIVAVVAIIIIKKKRK